MAGLKRTVKLVLLGLDFGSSNFGCAALGYSFLEIIENISKRKNIFFKITSVNYNPFSKNKDDIYTIDDLQVHYKSLKFYKKYIRAVKESDYVFDFTGGDSFTDIYGVGRFIKESLLKQIVINFGGRFIMGPQTIGPFNKKIIRKWAVRILSNSEHVFARDKISHEYARVLGIESMLTTDIAFVLPSADADYTMDDSAKIRIGFNISALMMNNGYSNSTSFGLRLDYDSFYKSVINYLEAEEYEIHLIAHVTANNSIENDYALCKKIHEEFPNTILGPYFQNPMQAKAYLGKMDCVIASRMHAAIGAFSMGVPIIAVSYSRKFQGLFNSLKYDYVIDAREEDENIALNKIDMWLRDLKHMRRMAHKSIEYANNEMTKFNDKLENILS